MSLLAYSVREPVLEEGKMRSSVYNVTRVALITVEGTNDSTVVQELEMPAYGNTHV